MRMLPDFFTGNWDDMFQGLLETEYVFDFPEPSEASEEISLHDLFDVEVDGFEEDANQEAVDGMFPERLLSEAESAAESGSGDSGVGEELLPVDLDLKCYEDGLPPSDPETDEATEAEEEAAMPTYVNENENELVLDCPENPGRGCRACPISDAEGESESGSPEDTDFPHPLTATPPHGIVRTTPCRVSCRRRPAVECIEDLLEEDPTDEPLNLSLKRPKCS
uniref:Early E1A protein n=1 Tax=Human adenovirus F serotype 40 TaxID=28284 RepID=Q64824_ADE40|nr:regulatory protein E1A12S [Human adenovirus 40]